MAAIEIVMRMALGVGALGLIAIAVYQLRTGRRPRFRLMGYGWTPRVDSIGDLLMALWGLLSAGFGIGLLTGIPLLAALIFLVVGMVRSRPAVT